LKKLTISNSIEKANTEKQLQEVNNQILELDSYIDQVHEEIPELKNGKQ